MLLRTGATAQEAIDAAQRSDLTGKRNLVRPWLIRPKELIAEHNEQYVFHPEPSSSDDNSNRGWLKNRECPECFYAGGFIWAYPACHVKMSDRKPIQVMLDRHPIDSDRVICECCGYEGPFAEWQLPTEEAELPKKYWTEGEEVACLRRRKGTGRERVVDLYRFFAKRGTDKVIRWCIDRKEICQSVSSSDIAQHICRYLKIQFIRHSLKHRQVVVTRATVAENSVTSI